MGRDERVNQARRRVVQGDFGAAVNQGTLTPMDRFGAPIQDGQLLLYQEPYGLVFRVASVKPVLDPRAPSGLVQVHLTAEFTVPAQVGRPLPMFLVVGTTQPAEAPPTGEEPPAADPPGEEPPPPSGITLTDVPPGDLA
jgi:hypothetical protein